MLSKKEVKIISGIVVALSIVIIIGFVYAGFTGQLNISGNAVNRQSNWDIHFENLSNITTTGTAKVLSQPRLASSTSIEDYSVSTTSPGDTISFTFKVVNEGNYNASISSVSVGTPECSGTDSTSNSNVCSKLTYTLTYDNGATVQTGDILGAKESVIMKVTLTYAEFNDDSLLATEDVSISGLGITINYQQSGSALVKDNGEVADYKVYNVGDKISLNSEDYYVIEKSGIGQDYVAALKDLPLTVAEVNQYGGVGTVNNHVNKYTQSSEGTAYNKNGYGGVAYLSSDTCNNGVTSGCTYDYMLSDVKYILDAWAADKFLNDELKKVDGYYTRLLKKNEYNNISSNYTFHKNYQPYWSMSVYISGYPQYVWDFGNNATVVFDYKDVVRPVINVYKSVLEVNNNE